jgi:3-methyladenine DNA glycosylase AlkD
MTASELLTALRSHANPVNVAGMARFGISSEGTLGVSIPVLRRLAREAGRDHVLALEVWTSGVHEARILASLIADPARMTRREADRWVKDFDSWDVCDQVCQNVLRLTPFAFEKAAEWARSPREFTRRAGFSLMAGLAVKAKTAPDAAFEAFFLLIVEAATDDRNMVKKAVNWALRQIGKRNARLHSKAIAMAEKIRQIDSRSARWIAADALRELRSRTPPA